MPTFQRILDLKPTGCELYQGDGSPNGALTPMGIGALCIVQQAGSVGLWQCTALPSTWVNTGGGGSGVPLSNVTASLADTTIDNTTKTETWTWTTATTQKLFSLVADALTSGTILDISSASAGLTGRLLGMSTATTAALSAGAVRIAGSGAYTGTLIQVDTSTVAGDGLTINANALAAGRALVVMSTSAALTGQLALFSSVSTGNLANGAVRVAVTAAHTGSALQVDTSTQDGVGLRINANALTTGQGLAVLSTAAGLTGNLGLFQSSTTGLLANGGVRLNFSGQHTGSAMQVDTSTLTGQGVTINANAMTSGSALQVLTSSGALNSTNGFLRVANTGASTTGIFARFQSSNIAGAGMTILGNGFVGLGTVTPAAQLHNVGSTVLGVVAVNDVAAGGQIGSAATTVDVSTSFTVNQTTAGQALTLPNPTTATAGRIASVMNVGTQSFTMYGVTVNVVGTPATAGILLQWTGAAWVVLQ